MRKGPFARQTGDPLRASVTNAAIMERPHGRELADAVGIATFRKAAEGVEISRAGPVVGDLGVPLAALGVGVNAVT